ncbi:MAG TPA: hypothetical protein VFW53_04600 [Gallionella sp.]|nr:hypothetical protein [Gallionella sp.]
MSYLECPYCRGMVPHGAFSCRGCRAEIEYGPPPPFLLVPIIVGAVAGYCVAAMLSAGWVLLGWLVGTVIAIGGIRLLAKIYRDRAVFTFKDKTK